MAKAEVKMSEPVVESVVLTLTPKEADSLMEFIGCTSIVVVEELMDWVTKDKQREVNSVLYEVFEALNKVRGSGDSL